MNSIQFPRPTKPKILIVDDNTANLVALKQLLTRLDAEVIAADNGNQALALTLDHDFVLILLDVYMPGIDGYEVASLLRGEERTSAIPIIFLTAAYVDEQHKLKGYESGAVDYLVKPINETMLLSKVSVFLELRTKEELLRVMAMLEQANCHLELEVERRRQSEITSRRLADTVFAETREGIMVTDRDGIVMAVNAAFSRMTGYASNEIAGHSASMLESNRYDPAFFKAMRSELQKTGHWQNEVWKRCKSGELFLAGLSVSAIHNQDESVAKYVFVITDITQRKQDEEKLWRQANFDHLTGLPNRALFLEHLSCAVADSLGEDDSIALMFIDIDRFKLVNDSLGHGVGDLLLQEVAARLCECVRGNDTVSRLSGDEFTIILKGIEDAANAASVAKHVIDSLSKPFYLNGNEVSVGASIGISLFPQDADTASSLLRNADMAMYCAKEYGRNSYTFFAREMDKRIQSMVRLSNDLRYAVSRNELELHYQPIIDAESLELVGAEALLRWKHPSLGMVSPCDFIPVAEDTGLIGPITEWVLLTACKDAAAWQLDNAHPLRIAINISNRHRELSAFVEKTLVVLEQTGLPRELLSFEITESYALEDIEKIQAIHHSGIGLSIDDFGTGYSSLSYLRRLPADTLKIDRSFINGLGRNADDTMLVKSIISIAHGLRMKVVAEGVETEEQLAYLQAAGCDLVQGYYFSKPLPADMFVDFIHEHSRHSERFSAEV